MYHAFHLFLHIGQSSVGDDALSAEGELILCEDTSLQLSECVLVARQTHRTATAGALRDRLFVGVLKVAILHILLVLCVTKVAHFDRSRELRHRPLF